MNLQDFHILIIEALPTTKYILDYLYFSFDTIMQNLEILPVVFPAQDCAQMKHNIVISQFHYLQEIQILQNANQKNLGHDALNILRYIS